MRASRSFVFLIVLCVPLLIASGGPADTQIGDRAKEVGRALRCVVCQNQSIEDSDAPLAEDMRRLVKAQIKSGKTNAEVIAFMQEQYGDYILLKPPVQANTVVLWAAPVMLLFGALLWALVYSKRAISTEVAPLCSREAEALRALQREQKGPTGQKGEVP